MATKRKLRGVSIKRCSITKEAAYYVPRDARYISLKRGGAAFKMVRSHEESSGARGARRADGEKATEGCGRRCPIDPGKREWWRSGARRLGDSMEEEPPGQSAPGDDGAAKGLRPKGGKQDVDLQGETQAGP